MGISSTGNLAFDAAVLLAERIRQTAQAGSPTQAQVRAADVAWFAAVTAAATASGGAVVVPNEIAAVAAINRTGNP
jgi:preprotein translocase subunit SecD